MPPTTESDPLELRTRRLSQADREQARALFLLMAEVFEEPGEEPGEPLGDAYLDRLLSRPDFWAIAALAGDELVGGLTAHTLMMTRTESSEIFIYDIAVRPEHQRKGVGRQLMDALRVAAAAVGIDDIFVPADNDDTHALDFYRALGGEGAPVTIFTFGKPDD
jgi:aminoglycoside 3-N-acetyltransferase I